MFVTPDQPFCVYTHSIDGKVFYVGKGDYARACSTRTRNRLWREKVGTKTFEVQIITRHRTDRDACQAEIALIKLIKPECNLMHRVSQMTPELRTQLSVLKKGKPRSEDAKRKMREGWARAIETGNFKGKKLSPVVCIETGERFHSLKAAGRAMSIDSGSIRKMLRGEVRHVGGYTFREAILDPATDQ